MIATIERVSAPSPAEFKRRYLGADRPAIFVDAVRHWPASTRWTAAWLRDTLSDAPVRVETLPESRGGESEYVLRHVSINRMRMRDFFSVMESESGRHYVTQQPVSALSPSLLDDLRPFPYYSELLRRWSGHTALLWLGSAGCTSSLHFDYFPNLNVQLFGSKRWVIFPRAQQTLLYLPSRLRHSHWSPVDVGSPDVQRFPLYSQATPIDFLLEPGETLFLPAGWPHYVETRALSAAVNFWWITWPDFLRRAPGHIGSTWWKKLTRR